MCLVAALLAFCVGRIDPALAGPALVIEMPSGAILYEDHATQPWYPASLTKLMTVYVALSAVRDHRITLDTPLAVSARAASMPPSKMGFRPGILVTLDNALKMLMVKSANDMAVVIAEGVSGSVEAFAEDMNSRRASLASPNRISSIRTACRTPRHVSSARDLAILARALYLTFPEQANLFNIGAMRLGDDIIHNHNDLLGRYPGVDGMKTGFTCAAGFNIVASASQNGRQLIAVIMGAPNARSRMIMAAALFDRGFAGIDKPSKSLADLTAQTAMNSPAAPPDLHASVCGKRGKAMVEFNTDISRVMAPLLARPAKAPRHGAGPFALMTTAAFARPLANGAAHCDRCRGLRSILSRSILARPPAMPDLSRKRGRRIRRSAHRRPRHRQRLCRDGSAGAGEASSPLAPAPDALPMKGQGAKIRKGRAITSRDARRMHHQAWRARKKHGSRQAVKAAQQKAVKTPPNQRSVKPKKLAAKQHPRQRPPMHAEKTKSKKPEKHAKAMSLTFTRLGPADERKRGSASPQKTARRPSR